MKAFFVLCVVLATSEGQSPPGNSPQRQGQGDLPFNPLPPGEQGDQLVHFMSVIGQIFNETQKNGGRLGGMGDLIDELQEVLEEGNDGDIIESFTDFLQTANEHLGSLGFDVQYNITAIVEVLQRIQSLSESGRAPDQDLTDRYMRLLMEPLQAVLGGDRGTPGLNPANMGPNRRPARRARGCDDMRTIFPDMAESLDLALRQARNSVGGLIEYIGDDGLPMACVKELLDRLQPGQCNPGHIRQVICKVDVDPDVLRGFLDCLDPQDVCRTLELLKTLDCVTESANHGSLAGMLLRYQCGDAYMTVDVLSSAPLSVLHSYIPTLQASDLLKLLREFKGDISLLEGMPCDKRRYLSQAVNTIVFEPQDSDFQARLTQWNNSMTQLVNGFYANGRQPSPSEVSGLLTNNINELFGLLMTFEKNIAPPDLETTIGRINNALETAQNPAEVNIRQMLGPVDTWVGRLQSNAEQIEDTLNNFLENLKPLFPYLSWEVCSRIPIAMVIDHLEELGSEEFKCSVTNDHDSCEHDGECGRAIVYTVLKQNSVDLADEEGRQMLGSLIDCLPKQKLRQTVVPGNCAHFEPGLTPTAIIGRQLAERCLPENTDLSFMGHTDIRNMGCLFTQLPLTSLRRIAQESLCFYETLPLLVRCLAETRDIDSSVARFLSQRCSSEEINRDMVEYLGPTVVQAPQRALQALRRQDLSDPVIRKSVVDGIQHICSQGQRDCAVKARMVQEKLNDLTTASQQESLMKTMSLNQFKKKIYSDEGIAAVEEALNLDEGNDPRGLQTSQRQFVLKMLLKEFKHPSEISEDKIEELGSLVLGLGSDLMLQLDPFSRLRLAQRFASFDGWQHQQPAALRIMLKDGLADENEKNPWSQFTPSMVQNCHPNAVLGLLPEDLDEMTNDTCDAVCRKFDKASQFDEYVSQSKAKSIAEVCLRCRGIDTTDSELSEEDVSALGETLITSLGDDSILDRIPDDVLIRTARLFRRFHRVKKSFIQKFTSNVSAAVAKRLESEGEVPNYQSLVEDLGIWALSLDQETRVKLHDDLLNIIDEIREVMEINSDIDIETSEAGELLRTLRTSLMQFVEDSVSPINSPSRRRKRATSWTPKCVDLKTMGAASLELTTDQIRSMSSGEVDNCMTMVGNNEKWSEQQYQAWAQRFIEVTGPVCAMSSENLQRFGSIAYTISVKEIECLENLDDDAVASLGALSQWKDDQMAAFATRYIQLSNLPSASKLTADHVVNMGHFLCGLSADDIRTIPNEIYESTSSLVGSLRACGQEPLEALGEHAEHLYGDAAKWDAAVYADVGIVLGGLDGKDLAAATYPEIEVWTRNAINHIKPEALKELNADQLGWLSRPQAMVLTEDQKASLDEEAKEAVDDSVNSKVDVVKASGATQLHFGLACTIMWISATTLQFVL